MSDALDPVELAAELTIAWLSNPHTRVTVAEVPGFLRSMHDAVTKLSSAGSPAPADASETSPEYTPAVSVRKSLASRDHIISMIDGKPYRTLRRHLSSNGLTPEEYRQRYGLKHDYPMIAPGFSESRSAIAKTIGLGRKRSTAAAGKTGDSDA